MSCPCTFQPAIQVNCVLELIGLVRSGGLVASRAEALEHVGCIVGSLGAFLGGESPPVMTGIDPDATSDIEQTSAALEAALTSMQADESGAINPDNLALILQFLTQLLPLLLPLFVKK